jgi:hypothetical protein
MRGHRRVLVKISVKNLQIDRPQHQYCHSGDIQTKQKTAAMHI